MSPVRSRTTFFGVTFLLIAVLALSFGGAIDPDVSARPVGARHAISPASPTPTPSPTRSAKRSKNVYAAITNARLSPAVRGIRTLVYVPDNVSNDVRVIDPKTFRVVRVLHVGVEPQHITPAWNMKRLYVGNVYSNTLTVIDPRTARPVGTIHVPDPYNLYFTPDGKHAIDVAEGHDTLYFYNPSTWRPQGSIRIPFHGPDHLDFSRDGSFFLISTEYSGAVVKVDVAHRKVLGAIQLGGSTVDVKLSPFGHDFYVANQDRAGVYVIDPVHMRQVAFIPTGAGAHGFAIARDAVHLYVANRLAGTISVIDTRTRTVVRTWHVGGSPDMLQVSADGRQLWVSNRFDASVSVIDTRNGRVLHVIPVGIRPHGLTLFPQPGRFSLGHNGVYR
jgi:YVTN family beta-propeller protein